MTAIFNKKKIKKNALPECIFGQIFKESIRGSRDHCKRMLKSLLNHFASFETSTKLEKHSSLKGHEDVFFLSFVAEILVSCSKVLLRFSSRKFLKYFFIRCTLVFNIFTG